MAHKNPSNSPDRIFIESDDMVLTGVNTGSSNPVGLNNPNYEYNQINVNLRNPVLGCKGLQLATFVQCNNAADGPCIPDYSASLIGFCYYNQAAANTIPSSSDLRVIYLLRSDQVISSTTYTPYTNRYFSTYSDFVTALNAAAVFLGSGTTDVEFFFDNTTRQIAFRGLNPARYYMPAGWNDPLVRAWISNPSNAGTLSPIPYGYTLNQRVGFTQAFYNFTQQKLGGSAANNFMYPNGYPNLVRTNSIILRTNINGQSSIQSNGSRDLLAVVPQTVPFLGVNHYQYTLNHMMTSVPDTIQTISINMFDDAGQPYPVANNVNTVIELLCKY